MQLKLTYNNGRMEIVFQGDLAVLDRKIMAYIRDSVGEKLLLDVVLSNDNGKSLALKSIKVEDLLGNWVNLRETFMEWGYNA